MNKRNKIVFIFALVLLTNSCVIANRTKYNNDKGEQKATNICSVHNFKMHKRIVGASYGLLVYTYPEDYSNAEYPNAKHRVHMGCVKRRFKNRLAMIYVCSECNEAKKKSN